MTDLTRHPQYTANDLAYLRAKGWSDQQISDRWDMEQRAGQKPCAWEGEVAATKLTRTLAAAARRSA